jgi:c-di-GMP-related signal transduction protein
MTLAQGHQGAHALGRRTTRRSSLLVARQPIYNARVEVTSYELLFRSLPTADLTGDAGTQATARLIVEFVLEQGTRVLTEGHPVHVNFTRELIVGGYAHVVPADSLVIEVLEDVPADDEVLEALRELREGGYSISLDDVTNVERAIPFRGIATSVKVDLPYVAIDDLARLVDELRSALPGVELVAEKVETWEMFQLTKRLGFDRFQGYFLSKPIIVEARSVPAFKPHYLKLLDLTSRPQVDLDAVENIVRSDLALTNKLLRSANSAKMGQSRTFKSIRQALVLLGAEGVRRTAALATLAGIGGDRPQQLLIDSVVRARFFESLSEIGTFEAPRFDLFLLGMFSMVDAILGVPMEQVVEDLPVPDAVRSALTHDEGQLGAILQLAEGLEHAEWDRLEGAASALALDVATIPPLYADAVEWAGRVFAEGNEDNAA